MGIDNKNKTRKLSVLPVTSFPTNLIYPFTLQVTALSIYGFSSSWNFTRAIKVFPYVMHL